MMGEAGETAKAKAAEKGEAVEESEGREQESSSTRPQVARKKAKKKSKKRSSSAKKRKKKSRSSSKRKSSASKRPKKAKICDYRTPVYEHVVQEGEHLGLIAGRYGILRKDLVRTNPELSNPDLIRPGQKVNVCPELPPREVLQTTHVVSEGESLGKIAKLHGMTLTELMAQQEGAVRDPNRIRIGQTLRIVKPGEIIAGFDPDEEEPVRGRMLVNHRLPQRDGYFIRRPHNAYGTSSTVKLIQRVVERYKRKAGGGPAIHIGDISRKGGGALRGHLSHRRGTDVDIGLVLKGKDADTKYFVPATKDNLDLRRTWLLLWEFLRTERVRYIFLDYRIQKRLYEYAKKSGVSESTLDEYFQYPRGIGRHHGIIRHWRGHHDHIHVRFRR